ncbi:DNA repair protein RecO [Thermoproteota archaeon]
MKTIKTDAIIFKSTHFFENDKLIEAFTPKLGKIKILAKGAGSSIRRFGGRIEPANLVQMVLYQGKSFYNLSQCQLQHSFLKIRDCYTRITMAFYCFDIIRKATLFDQHNKELFHLTHETLFKLNNLENPWEIKSFFEQNFLQIEGLLNKDNVNEKEFQILFENYAQNRLPEHTLLRNTSVESDLPQDRAWLSK